MPSNLTFASTQAFRDRLLTRNLSPYRVPGVYAGQPVQQIVQEYNQSDYSIIDSPDQLIANDPFADVLYPLNEYGPNGGYNKNINIGGLANTRSNQGPYDYLDAKLPQLSSPIELHIPTQNKYSSSDPLQLISINNIQSVPTFKQYADPLNFIPSTYSPYEILMQKDPNGDNGTLSQDSYIVQLGAKELKKLFRDRIAQNIDEKTIGRFNLLNAVGNPVQAIMVAQGKVPLIEKDWTITRPSNIALRATDFLARLGGFYYPSSVIPGDYWTTDQQNLSSFGQIAKAFNNGENPRDSGAGRLFGRFLFQPSPSQLFLDNTGAGTKNQLYYNLSFNRYSPQYRKSILNTVFNNAKSRINAALDIPQKGGYYVGNEDNTVSIINSPPGELPLNSFGQEVQSPVYGQDRLSKEYEGQSLGKFKFGLNGNELYSIPQIGSSPSNAGEGASIAGGFVFTSRNANGPGYTATVGGGRGPKKINNNKIVEPQQTVREGGTINVPFKAGSILDQTQRILNSAPKSNISHAGTAINQLSKVFNDGYKEMTKGSQVLSWTYNAETGVHSAYNKPTIGPAQNNAPNVYCRVFTKDTPYYTYNDLQKTDGNIRKFEGSVLDKTYSLNITPLTNSSGGKNIVDGKVKKYMFSLENLAWRTSNRPGLTVNDLPECERGPNGGRIMWFPPYDIKFSETSTPSFKGQDFLGRPEPVYTYTNTKRSGTLSWKIIVDHPSILNVIARKAIEDSSKSNSIIESFFAGCLKYDIYELAKRWPTLSVNELFSLQEIVVQNKNIISKEAIEAVQAETPVAEDKEEVKQQPKTPPDFNKYAGYSYYFDNNIPTDSTSNWETLYQTYIGQQTTYQQSSPTNEQKNATGNFFTSAITFNYEITNELYSDVQKFFTDFAPTEGEQSAPSLSIELVGSASAVASNAYNKSLSERRIQSVINYLQQSSPLAEYFTKGWLRISSTKAEGEESTVFPITRGGANPNEGIKSSVPIDCTKLSANASVYEKKFSPQAMACRRVSISNIVVSVPEPKKTVAEEPVQVATTPTKDTENKGLPTTGTEPPSSTTKIIQNERKQGLTKRVLRALLSECDYFDLINQNNPMFYNSIQERLKYFNPAFHSMTPEGLNARLTFLQQCMRPGDTIPVINKDGKAEYNNSVNTSFGAPPVLVLRIGDFFNTKIIPQSLQIGYEPLLFDLNPEGIGVQPMLANISLNFEIVGGEGLNGPIDKLQNALSFNFYANTEMYDERADETDTSYPNYDEFLWDKILSNTPLVGINNVGNQIDNDGGNTIGEIQSRFFSNAGVSGETTFRKIMDEFNDGGQEYINAFYNKSLETIENYNLPILCMFLTGMEYNQGNAMDFTGPQFLNIFGKSNSYQQNVDDLFDKIIEDIENQNSKTPNGNGLIFTYYNENFSDKKVINVIKNNLIDEVNKNRDVVKGFLTSINNTMTDIQQKLVKIMAKLDVVDTLTDGYIKSNQSVQILNLTPTTGTTIPINTANELSIDYSSGATQLYSFYQLFESFDIINNDKTEYDFDDPYILMLPNNFLILGCNVCTEAEKRFFVGMYNVLKNPNSYENFRNAVLTSDVSSVRVGGTQTTETVWFEYFGPRKDSYDEEWESEKKYFKDSFSSEYETNYKSWTPFVKGKERRYTYDTYTPGTSTQVEYIKNLYKDGNSDTDSLTFNGKNKFN